MKSIVAAAFIASLSTTAFSKIMVEYDYATRGDFTKGQLVDVSISEDGDMTLEVRSLNEGIKSQAIVHLSEHLAQSNFNQIKSLAEVLSNAKVTTTFNKFICMTFVAPIPQGPQALKIASGFERGSNEFKGDLRLVKTPNQCYHRSFTAFVSPQNTIQANRLEGIIEALANSALDKAGFNSN